MPSMPIKVPFWLPEELKESPGSCSGLSEGVQGLVEVFFGSVHLLALLAYFEGKTELKVLCLVLFFRFTTKIL